MLNGECVTVTVWRESGQGQSLQRMYRAREEGSIMACDVGKL